MKRKPILISVCCVLVAALLVGGFFAWRALAADPVKVYPVSYFGYQDWYSAGGTSSSGAVRTGNLQTVYLSETQQVTNLLVSDGQEVKQGDVLLEYDSALSELQLAKKQLEVEQAEHSLKKAKEEYNSLAGTKVYPLSFGGAYRLVLLTDTEPVETEPEVTEPTVPTTGALPGEKGEEGKVEAYFLVGGSGTEKNPYLYVIAKDIPFDADFLSALLQDAEQAYVVFARTEEDLFDGIVTNSWGICFARAENGTIGFTLFTTDGRLGKSLLDPTSSNEIEELPPIDDPPIVDPGPIGPSWEEILARKKELEQQIREGEVQLRVLQAELERMQKELGDGKIYAEYDGVISMLSDPESAAAFNTPLLKVSGGGGYYIDGSVSELALSSVQVGQTVTVNAWESGTFCEGVVESVSTTPSDNYGWGNGNPNVTYYVYTVFVDGSNNLMEGEWAEVTLGAVGEGNGAFFMDKAFILQENGKSYAYLRGEDGRLEKRELLVGKDLYGSSLEIRSGLTMEDFVAFPYGAAVKSGAKTVEGKPEDLYH